MKAMQRTDGESSERKGLGLNGRDERDAGWREGGWVCGRRLGKERGSERGRDGKREGGRNGGREGGRYDGFN